MSKFFLNGNQWNSCSAFNEFATSVPSMAPHFISTSAKGAKIEPGMDIETTVRCFACGKFQITRVGLNSLRS